MKKMQLRFQSAAFKTGWLALSTLLAACVCSAALAQTVTVSNPWARATVIGQKGAGIFMTLSSTAGARLMSASSPIAAFGQVHEMRMDANIMKMRALKEGLELPAGKTVELKPGSFHVMLMDLKMPLLSGTTVPVTLAFVDVKGIESTVDLTVPVNAMTHVEYTH